MDIFIKNMVCDRCIKVVRGIFQDLALTTTAIKLGEVTTKEPMDKQVVDQLRSKLAEEGFEMIEDKSSRLVSTMKSVIIESIYKHPEILSSEKLSTIITSEIPSDYSHLSQLFCSVEGVTLERYFILQKIERIKELIVYDEMNLSEIAHHLGYSSVQHLSNQFKKITGLTPSYYRKVSSERKSLDKI